MHLIKKFPAIEGGRFSAFVARSKQLSDGGEIIMTVNYDPSTHSLIMYILQLRHQINETMKSGKVG